MTEGLELTLLPRGGLVLCAVSGGADSVCLLRLLLEAAPGLNMRVECAHFNHCLRGAESDRDEAFVRSLCARLGVPAHFGRGDVAASGPSAAPPPTPSSPAASRPCASFWTGA